MNFNWKIISQKLYGILKSPGKDVKNISMYNEKGQETIDPAQANRFFAEISSAAETLDSYKILVAIRDEGQSSHIDVKTPNLVNDDDFNRVEKLVSHIKSAIGSREGIKINWQQFDKEIDTREEAMHNISESKDVGKLSGTTKSSFQRIGDARLIVRHTDTVNEEKHGARTRHIRALFVENKKGERFSYPHLHMTGARAFARHISNGGLNHDNIAQNIFSLSEDYLSLKNAAKALRLQESTQHYLTPIKHSMEGINKKLKRMHGPKGYANITKELVNENSLIDMNAIENLQKKLAESCQCQQDSPMWNDLGVAAKYMAPQPMSEPITFTWSRRPDMSSYAHDNLPQRMHDQIIELAAACTNEEAAVRLREVANLIMQGHTPPQSDLEMVKEAFASSLRYVPDRVVIPEQAELDSFIAEFELNNIFSEDNSAQIVNNFYKSITKSTDIDDKADKLKQAEMGRYGPAIAKDVNDKMDAIAAQHKMNKEQYLEQIVDIFLDNLAKGVYRVIGEDAAQDSVSALVAAGEDPNEAEKEVMDIKTESTSNYSQSAVKDADDYDDEYDDGSLGHVHNYGDIIAKAGDKVLTVDEDEEYDADGELENVKRRYTVLTDLGNNKYKREDDQLDVTPYDKSNKAALDAFRKLYNTEDTDKTVDEGFWDNVKQAGKEFWHGTDVERAEKEATKQAYQRYKQDPAGFKEKPVNELPDDEDNIKENTEFLYKKLRMNPDGSVDVVGFYTAPENSVLAGQTLKRFINSYDSEEAAKQAHPDAEGYSSKWTDPQVSLRHLPGEDDPVPGGMYPDDIKENIARIRKLAGI